MAQPTSYTPTADFSDLEAADPADGLATIGTKLDVEFSALNTTIDATLVNLALLQRDDGELANRTVGPEQLNADLAASLGEATIWATATAYAVDDVVIVSNAIYECEVAHTSGTFATDLAAVKWVLLVDYGATVFSGTSTTSLAIGTGSKVFTTQASKAFNVGTNVIAVSDSAPTTKYMFGKVTAYSSTSLTVDVLVASGSTTHADWTIYGRAGERGAAGASGATDLSTLTNLTTLDDTNDEFLVRDDSDSGTNKAITVGNFLKCINALTAETAVDTADLFVVYDASASTADKATLANVLKGTTTLTDTVITASDEILFCDVSDSNNAKKDTIQGILDLVSGVAAINTLSAETAPAIDDLLDIWDTSEAAENSMRFDNFFKVINGLTSDGSPDTAADYVVTYDASAGSAKKVLLSAFAGGVAATTTTAGVVELATATEVATGSDTARVPSVSVMGSHQSAAKFWANIDGSGTVTIRDSYNVTSITDNGTGDLTVTIATDFTGTSWCCLALLENALTAGAEANARYVEVQNAEQAAGTVNLACWDNTVTTRLFKDPETWHVAGFGDQ